MIKPNDRVRMEYYGRFAYGTVTIVSDSGIKVMFDGDYDLAYDYYLPSELEVVDANNQPIRI